MSQVPENSLRGSAEKDIKRRLNTSKWLQRGFAAAGLLAGIASAASSIENNSAIPEISVVSAFTMVGGAASERALTTASCRRRVNLFMVERYRQTGDASGLPITQTVLKVRDGDFKQVHRYDRSADVHSTPSGRGIVAAAITPTALWVGATMGAKLIEGGVTPGYEWPIGTLSVSMVAAGGVSHYMNEHSVRELGDVYCRQLDNIEQNNMVIGED